MQQHSGLLISEWPAIIGSDFAGVVVEVGPDTSRLKVGDYVCGVALLGRNRFAPFQQNFLVQEEIVLKKSPNVALEDSCTIGAGLLVSGYTLTIIYSTDSSIISRLRVCVFLLVWDWIYLEPPRRLPKRTNGSSSSEGQEVLANTRCR